MGTDTGPLEDVSILSSCRSGGVDSGVEPGRIREAARPPRLGGLICGGAPPHSPTGVRSFRRSFLGRGVIAKRFARISMPPSCCLQAWTGKGDDDFPATRNGYWAHCARIVRMGGDDGAVEVSKQYGTEHCLNPIGVGYRHLRQQAHLVPIAPFLQMLSECAPRAFKPPARQLLEGIE